MNLYYILFLSLFLSVCSAGTGKSYNDDAQLMVLDNKFKNNQPVDLENIIFTSTEEKLSSSSPCHQDLDLIWHASLPPLTASPILVDLEGDGRKEVLVATSLHYIEMIQGEDGSKTTGWPFGFPRSAFISSPITFDIDRDGFDDIVVTSHDGEIVFLRNNGQPHYNKTLVIPPLPIHRNWFDGLDLVNTDVSVNLLKPQETAKQTRKKEKRSTLELNIDDDDDEDNTYTEDAVKAMNTMLSDMTAKDKKIDASGFFTDPALQSLELFLPSSTPDTYITHLRTQQDPLYSPSYLSYLKNFINSWPKEKQRDYILVDPHVLSTPVIADLDGDGNQELIATVSYYFDQEYYNDQVHRASKIPQDIDMANYVAGAIIVFDLQKLEIKWLHDLDLTTDYTAYRAYMYSSPTVADFDNDGTLEIVVSTALGLVYVFNFDGTARGDNFPLLMDAIYAPVTLEDVNGDGALELIVVDANSNIVCYDTKGSVVWENRLSGFPDEAPVIGDVDGNGILDVVVGTNEGHIWAFQGTDGKQVSNFPVKLKGRIESQLLLIDAEREREGEGKGMKIVVHDLDGHVYVIEGATGCSDKIDIGEPSHSMVLADDLTGNGFLDLLVSTSSGNIYCLGTSIPFHPSSSWLSQDQNRNGFITGKHRGIYVLEQSRQFRDITGSHFYVSFEIVDKSYSDGKAFKYDVIIRHGGVNLFGKRYYTPGVYTEQIPVPNERAQVTITVEMINKHGIASFDSFGVSFNLQFHRTIKWIIIGPFALIALILLFVNDLKKQPLL